MRKDITSESCEVNDCLINATHCDFPKCKSSITHLETVKFYLVLCVSLVNVECDPTAIIPDISPEHVRREVGLSHWLWCTVPPTDSIQLFTCDTDGQWVKNYSSCGK